MGKARLEAFSDGIIAIIIITIMVLEMRALHGTDLAALRPVLLVFLLAVIAWRTFQAAIIGANGGDRSLLAQAVQAHDWKGIVPLVFYAAAIPLAFVHPAISGLLYVAVAVMWLVPDRRIEARIQNQA